MHRQSEGPYIVGPYCRGLNIVITHIVDVYLTWSDSCLFVFGKECGCTCEQCGDSSSLHLHVEIENLKQRLFEREHHIVKMETNFLKEADKFPNGEMAALTDELLTWQDKYSRSAAHFTQLCHGSWTLAS